MGIKWFLLEKSIINRVKRYLREMGKIIATYWSNKKYYYDISSKIIELSSWHGVWQLEDSHCTWDVSEKFYSSSLGNRWGGERGRISNGLKVYSQWYISFIETTPIPTRPHFLILLKQFTQTTAAHTHIFINMQGLIITANTLK